MGKQHVIGIPHDWQVSGGYQQCKALDERVSVSVELDRKWTQGASCLDRHVIEVYGELCSAGSGLQSSCDEPEGLMCLSAL